MKERLSVIYITLQTSDWKLLPCVEYMYIFQILFIWYCVRPVYHLLTLYRSFIPFINKLQNNFTDGSMNESKNKSLIIPLWYSYTSLNFRDSDWLNV